MLTDDGIADLFDKVAADLDPPVGAIVGRSERLGRRLRARRRAGIAAGNAVAVVAVAGTTLAVGMHQARPAAGPSVGAAAASAASASPGSGGKVPAPPPDARRKHPRVIPSARVNSTGGMTRRAMLRAMRSLLPAGSILSDVRTDTGRGSLEFDYNDGQGAVDFDLFITSASVFHSKPLACAKPPWNGDEGPRPAGALPISCVLRTLADGTVERDWVTGADVKSFYAYNIIDVR